MLLRMLKWASKLSHMTVYPAGRGEVICLPTSKPKWEIRKRAEGHEWCFCLHVCLTQFPLCQDKSLRLISAQRTGFVLLSKFKLAPARVHSCAFVHWNCWMFVTCEGHKQHSCNVLQTYRRLLTDGKLRARPQPGVSHVTHRYLRLERRPLWLCGFVVWTVWFWASLKVDFCSLALFMLAHLLITSSPGHVWLPSTERFAVFQADQEVESVLFGYWSPPTRYGSVTTDEKPVSLCAWFIFYFLFSAHLTADVLCCCQTLLLANCWWFERELAYFPRLLGAFDQTKNTYIFPCYWW